MIQTRPAPVGRKILRWDDQWLCGRERWPGQPQIELRINYDDDQFNTVGLLLILPSACSTWNALDPSHGTAEEDLRWLSLFWVEPKFQVRLPSIPMEQENPFLRAEMRGEDEVWTRSTRRNRNLSLLGGAKLDTASECSRANGRFQTLSSSRTKAFSWRWKCVWNLVHLERTAWPEVFTLRLWVGSKLMILPLVDYLR